MTSIATGRAPTFVEFFAGGGMARAGLEGWTCLLANDVSATKAAVYRENWGDDHLIEGDVRDVRPHLAIVPGLTPRVDLAWASFPCQDLSLAGRGAGLDGQRSSALIDFFHAVDGLAALRRKPAVIVLENVLGALTSNDGADFRRVVGWLRDLGYRVGAVTLDAADFVPQSRPRVFFIALDARVAPPASLVDGTPDARVPQVLIDQVDDLAEGLREGWLWWRLATPAGRSATLGDIVERDAPEWDEPERSRAALAMMSEATRAKLDAVRAEVAKTGRTQVGAFFRRTRVEGGRKIQHVEIRFDGLAGCLRTAAGGSSVQRLLFVERDGLRTRAVTPREAARLMGLPETYRLPQSRSQALDLLGDGVAVPVVAHLAQSLLALLAAAA